MTIEPTGYADDPLCPCGVRHHQGRYCAPARCYCGGCPSWRTTTAYPTGISDSWAAVDSRAVASGRRRSSQGDYQAAKATVEAQKERRSA